MAITLARNVEELNRYSHRGRARGTTGRPARAVLQVDTAGGPVICGIERDRFPERRLPPPQQRITVDHTPTGCAPPPVSNQLPRWAVIMTGAGGLALMVFWLWAGRPSARVNQRAYRRPVRR
ncbi:hypothetical protein [Plantactinospora sp. B5E13]|uniref:hypothetical protein n=1 Tax=unclassified Plantactinospora TaxID=2631981 RepID=UPI00325ED1CD